MKYALALGCTLLAACENPPLSLRFRLTPGDSQQCFGDTGTVTTSCQDVTMGCDAYLSVRILPPDDPEAPYISVCRPLTGAQSKLCAIAGIDLPQPAMPVTEQVLEVQMAVFPASAITNDPETGEPVCPRVRFAANGLPVPVLPICDPAPDPFACPQVPAVGGRTFYRPGDAKTVVELGCTQLEQITKMCEGGDRISVSATVNDFDDVVSSVDKVVADRLDVSIGEPEPREDTHVLVSNESTELTRTSATVPTWSGLVDQKFMSTACLEVLDVGGAETTAALTCQSISNPDRDFGVAGYYLKKSTLTTIIEALGLMSFPDPGGLVVGLVLDKNLNPITNAEVTPSCAGCTIKYLSSDRTGLVTGGTSDNGIFMSLDAPYGTAFSSPAIPATTLAPILGGVVEGKVTIVIIQDKEPVVGDGP